LCARPYPPSTMEQNFRRRDLTSAGIRHCGLWPIGNIRSLGGVQSILLRFFVRCCRGITRPGFPFCLPECRIEYIQSLLLVLFLSSVPSGATLAAQEGVAPVHSGHGESRKRRIAKRFLRFLRHVPSFLQPVGLAVAHRGRRGHNNRNPSPHMLSCQ